VVDAVVAILMVDVAVAALVVAAAVDVTAAMGAHITPSLNCVVRRATR
jgi:hypothetical protein